MDDDDFTGLRWPGRRRGCFWLAIVAAAMWWFLGRERPVSARRRVAILRDPAQRASSRYIAADHLQHADTSVVPDLVQTLKKGDALGRELAALAPGRLRHKADAAAGALAEKRERPRTDRPRLCDCRVGADGQGRRVGKIDRGRGRRRATVRRHRVGRVGARRRPICGRFLRTRRLPTTMSCTCRGLRGVVEAVGDRHPGSPWDDGRFQRFVRRTIVVLLDPITPTRLLRCC